MRQLARWCFAHRIIVVVIWLGVLAGVNVIHSDAGSAYSDNFKLPHTESFDAVRLLQRNAPKAAGDPEQIVIGVTHGRVTDAAARARVSGLLASVAQTPHVSMVASPYAAGGAGRSRRLDRWPSPTSPSTFSPTRSRRGRQGVRVEDQLGLGQRPRSRSGVRSPERATQEERAASLGFLAAAVVLFLVFGSLLAMALPLLTAGFSLGTGIAVVGLLSHVINMASFSSQLALLIGLGVGVDYALFIVTRTARGCCAG